MIVCFSRNGQNLWTIQDRQSIEMCQ